MHDSLPVSGIESIRHLDPKIEQPLRFERPVPDQVLQGCPVQKFHHDEGTAILLVDFVNRTDVRVIQSRGGSCLALETAESLGISGNVVRKELEGYEAAELCILGFVHNSHAPTAKFLDDA